MTDTYDQDRNFADALYGNHAGETRIFVPGIEALICMEAVRGDDGVWRVQEEDLG